MAPTANAKYAIQYTSGRTATYHFAAIGAQPEGPMVVSTAHWVTAAVPAAGVTNGSNFTTSMHVLEFLLLQCFKLVQ